MRSITHGDRSRRDIYDCDGIRAGHRVSGQYLAARAQHTGRPCTAAQTSTPTSSASENRCRPGADDDTAVKPDPSGANAATTPASMSRSTRVLL